MEGHPDTNVYHVKELEFKTKAEELIKETTRKTKLTTNKPLSQQQQPMGN